MRRRFEAFDAAVINREFSQLPTQDFKDLTFAMQNYQEDTGVHYRTDNYGNGLEMIAGGQGRCLFFTRETEVHPDGQPSETLVALTIGKKESQKASKQLIERARDRMKRYKEKQK